MEASRAEGVSESGRGSGELADVPNDGLQERDGRQWRELWEQGTLISRKELE
jgi:hypothetical protein